MFVYLNVLLGLYGFLCQYMCGGGDHWFCINLHCGFILHVYCHSILGRIVRVTEDVVAYRKWVKENFVVLTPSPNRSSYAAIVSSNSSTNIDAQQNRYAVHIE